MIGICLCFKDCAPYLEEWLLFHFVQGVRRFYLYNNDSQDDWLAVAAPWIRRGLVVPVNFPGLGKQQAIYDHCLRRARGEVDWLAFLDDDEFLFPTRNETLSAALANYANFAGVAVSWVVAGSGGREHATPGWVLERFPATIGSADRHVKCIVRPERVMRSKVIGHMFYPTRDCQIVDENMVPLSEPLNPAPSAARLRINHYLIKSWEEWRVRRARPRASTGEPPLIAEGDWRAWDAHWAKVPDATGVRFMPAMRAAQALITGSSIPLGMPNQLVAA
jgi:Glycosyltransferase family 92